MIIKEELLSVMLENYPNWSESPEDFLSFITMMDQLSEADGETHGTELSSRDEFAGELAELFISVLGVDISPYRDFFDLRENCVVPDDMVQILNRILDKMKANDAIFDLTIETGIMPSKEAMLTDIAKDFLAQAVIE